VDAARRPPLARALEQVTEEHDEPRLIGPVALIGIEPDDRDLAVRARQPGDRGARFDGEQRARARARDRTHLAHVEIAEADEAQQRLGLVPAHDPRRA
jgi:hypothetical protein